MRIFAQLSCSDVRCSRTGCDGSLLRPHLINGTLQEEGGVKRLNMSYTAQVNPREEEEVVKSQLLPSKQRNPGTPKLKNCKTAPNKSVITKNDWKLKGPL